MYSETVIGILALTGPHSLIPFLEKIKHYSQNLFIGKKDISFPNFLIFSLANNALYSKNINEVETKRLIKNILENYKEEKLNCLVVIGNDSCLYFDYISKLIHIPVLNIVTETLKLLSNQFKFPALLANENIVNRSIYQNELNTIGINVFHDDVLQNKVNELIISVKQTGITSHSKKIWKNIYNYCEEKNCDSIISDFAELSILMDNKVGKNVLPIYDTNDTLAISCIKNYLNVESHFYKKAL